MQDRDQYDTRQLVSIAELLPARSLICMDYKFIRRFSGVKNKIFKICGINEIFVMTPSEFLEEFTNGKIGDE